MEEQGIRVRPGDFADAAAIALTEESPDGITPNLTASEAIDLEGIVAIASELTGHPIHRVVVPDAEYRADLGAGSFPEPAADMILGLFVASRQGEFAHVDPTLARLIGRPPTPLKDFLKAALSPVG